MEILIPYAIVLLLGVIVTMTAFRDQALAFSRSNPGIVQVALEACVLAAVAWGALWLFILASPPVLLGVVLIPLPAIAIVIWPAFRTLRCTINYVVIQALVASVAFFLPVLVATGIDTLVGPPPNEGAESVYLGIVAAGFGWPLYVAIIVAAAGVLRVRGVRAVVQRAG